MRHTMQYSVNGQTMDVGADENDQFMQAAAERGYKPEAVHTYRINNETMQVPESQLNDFMSASKQRGYEPQRIQRLTMDDGETVDMAEKDIEDFAYNAANGFRISRKDMERAGVPQMKVRSAADRAKFGTELAQMFHPEFIEYGLGPAKETPKQNLGIWETLRQQKQQELGKEIGDAELTATLLPGIGTIMSAAERGKESNEQRLYFGNYRDPLEASRLALAVGIPQETVAQINAKASAGQTPRRPFGGLDSDQYDMKVLGDEYKKLMNDALKERIIARQNAGEQLSQNELSWLQNAAVGAVGSGAAIAEMANPVVASATLGASAMNRAARMANGPLELDENGNVRREAVRDQYGNVVTREDGSVVEKRGTDGDTAMLKGFAGAAAERVIWSGATAKAFKALPGGAKVASRIERGGFLKKNAGELAGMVAKTRLTELADEVAGLNVADYESGESFGDWLVKTANPVETVKTALELLPVHGAMKAFGKIKNYASKDAREHMANVKKAREDIDKAIGEGKSKNLTDAEVLKLHELSTSDGLTQEKIDSFVSKVGKDADASKELFSAAADFAKQMRGSGFRMSREASDALASDIVQNVGTERAKEVFDKAKVKFKNPKELEDPDLREKAILEAADEVFGEQGNDGERRIANADKRTQAEVTAHNRYMRTPTRVGEKEIAEDQEARAMGRRIEQEGELQRVNDKLNRFKKMVEIGNAQKQEQAEYDEKMAAYEEARAQRAAEKKRGVSPSKLTPLPEKPVRPDESASAPAKTSENPAKVDKGTAEKPVEVSAKPENRGEVVQPTKLPDGRGKMVEKPQTEQPSQPLENAPSRAPKKKGTTSQANGAEGVEAQNGANGVASKPKTYEEIAKRLDELTEAAKPKNGQKGDVVAGNRAEGYKAVASALGYDYSPKKRILKSQLEQIAKELRANEQHFDNRNSEMAKLYAARREGNLEAVKDAGLEVYTDENGLTQVREAKKVKSPSSRVPDGKGRMVKKAESPAPTAKAEGDPAYRVERRGKSYVIVSRNGNGQMLPTGGWTKLEASDNPTLFKTEKEANEVAAKFNRQEADLRSNLAGTTDMNAAEQISNLKAEEKAARARFNGERERVFGEIDDIIRQKADAVRKSWSKEIADEVDGILKKKTLSNDDMRKLGAYLIDAPSGGKPFKLKLGESGELTVNDNIYALLKTRNKVRSLGKEASKRYYEKSPSTPADRTSDPAIVEWAKKRGETVVTGADGKAKVSEETVRRFNADQIGKAVNATKNLIKGVKVEQVGREWSEELDNPDGADKSVKLKREGRVVGTYDPATKKVILYSGADASTVYHELIGHAVHDWAKDNSPPLYNKLNRLASEAPKELVDEIRRNYPDADEATLAKEIIAHIAGKKGMENITPKLKDKPSTWYAKAYVAVRDAILDFMQKVGFRRIDVKKLESLSPMEAMDYLTEQAAKGRMLGKAEATGDGALTKFERWAVKMYDRYMPISTVSKDAADAKALQPGKEYDFQLRNFDVKKKEFGKILAEGDIAEESVADYMRAQSAPERNRRLREEFLKENKGGNPSDYDLWVQNNGGSGWSDERAAEHMKFFNSLPKERQDAIKKAADFLWKMQKEGMDRRVEAGLISRDDADALMAAEQYHIPWKSAISEFDGEWRPWRGKNNFKSGEFAKAKGRATEAGDPIAWMFEEFSDAHLRAIENETRSILARDIEASGKFGKVIQNTPENQMKELRVKGGEGQANVVNFKRDGKTYSIVLEGERGDAIASGYTNRDLAHMPKKVQAFMRWWSSTATEWSPTFAVRNLIADNVDVARIVLAEQGVKQGVKTLAKYAVNRQRVFKEIMQYAWSGEMKKGGVLEQYSKEGGMIGGFQRQGYENLREQMSYENIRKQFEKDAKKGRNRTKSVLSLVPKAFVGIGHGIKTLNTYAELSSRVAMFKTNVDAGMSAKDAALYSRRITVDFNRKGNYTPVLNTLFMFSNSTIGATMRQIEAVHKGGKTPQGKRALALLFLQGLGMAAAEAWINSDDDENEKQGKGTWKDMPEHNYTSRLGIRVGDKFYGLPGHDDPLSRISWLGSSIGRMFFGKMKKADFAKEIGSFGTDMAGRFAGKGSTDIASGWNVLAPSALQWFFQALENKDFAGRPIQRPKFDDAQPWSQNGRASTPQSYKTVAEVLNAIGGGNEARSGKLFGIDKLSTDYSPEMIRHVFNSVFKNVGRDAGDLISMAEVGLRIADFDVRNAPIARNLVTKSNGNDNRFLEAQKAYKADMKELKDRESWKPGEKADYLKSHPWLREGSDGKTTVNRLINMTNRDNPRSGIGSMGITQLRKLTEGKVRRKDGTYFEPNTPISDELKEKAREMLQKRQARVIEIMGK